MDHSLKTIKTASTVTEKKYDLIKLLSFQFQFLLLPQKKTFRIHMTHSLLMLNRTLNNIHGKEC